MSESVVSWSGDIQPYVIGALIALLLIHVVRIVVTRLIYWFDDVRIDRQVKREFAELKTKREKESRE